MLASASSAAPVRSAGGSRPRSAPSAPRQLDRWCASPATAASTITWASSRPPRATRSRWVVVVNNNGAYGANRRSEPNSYRRDESREPDRSWKFGQHNFARIAQEQGREGFRIERPTDLGSALQDALASGKQVVLDVLTDPTASHSRAWGRSGWPTSDATARAPTLLQNQVQITNLVLQETRVPGVDGRGSAG